MKSLKRKFLVSVLALILPLGLTTVAVHADEVAPVIAVIDTGTNTALFKDKIVAEACFIEYETCPNGKSFMEGVGAANLPPTKNASFDHGTQLNSIILKINPSVKLLPIRIVGVNKNGNPSLYTQAPIKLALDWIILNRVKYNIVAVNVSQGKVFADCKVPAGLAEDVKALKNVGVAFISATGNDGNRTAINSPACVEDAISVGATDNPWPGVQPYTWDPQAKPYIARYSNGNSKTSFYTNARYSVTKLDGTTKFSVGTSNASAAFSAWWVLNWKGSYAATYEFLSNSSTQISNEWLTGKYISIPSNKEG